MDQLQVGLYVYLDLKWLEQPFAFGNFMIKNDEQIRVIRSLGLKSVRCDPALSSVAIAPPAQTPPPPEQARQAVSPALAAKQAMIARIKQQRKAAVLVEKAFTNTANALREIDKNLLHRPAESVAQASKLVSQISDSILSEPDLAIHVMGDHMGGEELYFHSLNVTILAMMMARDIKLPHEVVGALGMGSLFHDIGHKQIPSRILQSTTPLSTAERHLYEMHTHYGFEFGKQLGLAPSVMAILRDHHEYVDGSGYSAKSKGEAIGVLARIVVIANYYDELCNPLNIADALTPHEALSLMFAKLRSKFDPKLLQVFIRCLGVYPPGTIVQLSNGVIGMVTAININKPMKPTVMIYDADVPREEAILLDMAQETEVNIAKAVRPVQVAREIYNYLSPRKRVSYYFAADRAGQEAAAQ